MYFASALAFYAIVASTLLPVLRTYGKIGIDINDDDELDALVAKRRAAPILTQKERRDFLREHNRRRSGVKPPASDMMRMVWDVELEMLASDWSLNCAYKFGTPPYVPNAMQRLGQSLHIAHEADTVADVVSRWHGEHESFVYINGSGNSGRGNGGQCTERHQCVNYLQVVWANSYQLGCSRKFCDRIHGLHNSVFEQSYLIVCYYGPSGHVPDTDPYAVGGSPCSNCPSNQFRCENNLCVPIKPCSMVNDCYMKYIEDCLCDESFYWSAFRRSLKLLPVSWSTDGNYSLMQYLHIASNKDDQKHEYSERDPVTLDCPIDVVREPGFNSTITIIKDVHKISYIGEAQKEEDKTYIWIIVGVVCGVVFVVAVAIILAIVCRRYLRRRHDSEMLEGRRRDELFHARSY